MIAYTDTCVYNSNSLSHKAGRQESHPVSFCLPFFLSFFMSPGICNTQGASQCVLPKRDGYLRPLPTAHTP